MTDEVVVRYQPHMGNKARKRVVKVRKTKNIRVQLMTDIHQFVKIQEFMRLDDNIGECANESQATYRIIEKYFFLEEEIAKWKKIALATMDSKRQLEEKYNEGLTHGMQKGQTSL